MSGFYDIYDVHVWYMTQHIIMATFSADATPTRTWHTLFDNAKIPQYFRSTEISIQSFVPPPQTQIESVIHVIPNPQNPQES